MWQQNYCQGRQGSCVTLLLYASSILIQALGEEKKCFVFVIGKTAFKKTSQNLC